MSLLQWKVHLLNLRRRRWRVIIILWHGTRRVRRRIVINIVYSAAGGRLYERSSSISWRRLLFGYYYSFRRDNQKAAQMRHLHTHLSCSNVAWLTFCKDFGIVGVVGMCILRTTVPSCYVGARLRSLKLRTTHNLRPKTKTKNQLQ